MTKRTRHTQPQDNDRPGNGERSSSGASVVLEPEVFDRFIKSCHQGGAPNPALKRAATLANEKGIGLQRADYPKK